MTDKEAMAMALEALEYWDVHGKLHQPTEEAITAIKEALAQPEQHQDWCASLTQMLMSMPPKPAPCNCKPPQHTEQNFCSRCGKRTKDLITIHTCTPPKETT
jgi:hypothetical protein